MEVCENNNHYPMKAWENYNHYNVHHGIMWEL
jgi:hypothetical protein